MHGTAVPWEPQEMSGLIVQPFSEVLLCRHEIVFVLLHRRQYAQVTLHTAVVVISDVILNHGNKLIAAREASSVVPLPFEDAPKSFHWSIDEALGNSGHTLLHLCCFQFVVKGTVGILETPITVEQGMRVGIGFYGGV